jgi:hypothetical protein
MPYFHNDKINLLLIHIPKTGGTSLEVFFSKKYNIQLNNISLYGFISEDTKNNNNININSSIQHATYQSLIKYNNFFKINMNNIQIITIVRNPYERLISGLFWFKEINNNSTKEEVYNKIQKYLYYKHIDNHNIPQYLFVTDENNNIVPNIKILHTETLQKDMIKLGYTNFNNYLNCTHNPGTNYYKYLNKESIHLINEFYDYDFKLFNYEKITETLENENK